MNMQYWATTCAEGYLILFGSVAPRLCEPGGDLALGWLLLGEAVTGTMLVAALLIVAAVAVTARAMARVLAERANLALQQCKRSTDMAFDMEENAAVQATLKLSDRAFASADCKEGVRAFFAKGAPRFVQR
jgi:enoyl-CoA hydratase/carnithine racemase